MTDQRSTSDPLLSTVDFEECWNRSAATEFPEALIDGEWRVEARLSLERPVRALLGDQGVLASLDAGAPQVRPAALADLVGLVREIPAVSLTPVTIDTATLDAAGQVAGGNPRAFGDHLIRAGYRASDAFALAELAGRGGWRGRFTVEARDRAGTWRRSRSEVAFHDISVGRVMLRRSIASTIITCGTVTGLVEAIENVVHCHRERLAKM
ncbi:hypothetical protein D5S17_29390 [Pseudonocardiaceae bacterium YIM PH 21723]|nr:hypothetical protein D5S17_29390 [Pseudonocardiaceae bacterium YIM PH 21723]